MKPVKQKKQTPVPNACMHRRGQITIFIILAIIILFVTALYFYVQSSALKVRPPVEQLEVSEEVQPVQSFVTQCLGTVSRDALIKLGNNGGYIDPATISGLHIRSPAYLSDALVWSPQTMPYWYYLQDDCQTTNSPYGCLQTRKPPLCAPGVACVIPGSNGPHSIEEQLNGYIESHITDCINQFSSLKDRFSITAGAITADTQVNEKDVTVKLSYPLDITPTGTTNHIKIPYFVVKEPVKFKEMYLFATEIYEAEMNTTFLESMTLNLISLYSGIDEKLLPPLSGMQLFSPDKKYWVRSSVQSQLQNDVLPYMDFIQIVNAGNAKPIHSSGTDPNYLPYEEGMYRSLAVKVSNTTHFDLKANIQYPYADVYLRIGDSEVIKPKNINVGDGFIVKMAGLFINDYGFKYDLSYPVIVTVQDPGAFNGQGYRFSYAMEANIRQNVPISGNITIIGFGNGTRALALDSALQKPNRTITITSIDKHTRAPLDGVIIYYRCGPQYTIGQTHLENNGAAALLSARMPFCEQGGEIVYEKPGYLGSAFPYNNNDGNDDQSFTIALWPLANKTVQILKRTPTNIDRIRRSGTGLAVYRTEATPLAENDTVLLTFNKIKENPLETDVPLVGFMAFAGGNTSTITVPQQDMYSQQQIIEGYYANGTINASMRDYMLSQLNLNENLSQETIIPETAHDFDLAPGTYLIDATLLYTGTIAIPKETRTFCMGIDSFAGCLGQKKSVDLPPQNFTAWMTGGATLNFTLSENDVYAAGNLTLYVLEIPQPTNWEMIENAPTPQEYQQGKNMMVLPRLG